MDIVQAGDPVLRRRARAVSDEELRTPFVQQLIRLMTASMWEARGVGLAAPQVGESLQIMVMADDQDAFLDNLAPARQAELRRSRFPLQVVVNPALEPLGDEADEFFEGCLSVAGFAAVVKRHRRVRLAGVDGDGQPVALELDGWPARIAQHECDHLAGTLYIDRMDSRTFTTTANLDRYCKARPAGEVRRMMDG